MISYGRQATVSSIRAVVRNRRRSRRPARINCIVDAEGLLFIKQELAHFSNDQRFVHYEHVVVSVMQFDDSRVLHA